MAAEGGDTMIRYWKFYAFVVSVCLFGGYGMTMAGMH